MSIIPLSHGPAKVQSNRVQPRLTHSHSTTDDEHNLEVYDSGDGVNCGGEDVEYGSGDTYAMGKEPYYWNRSDDFATLQPAPTRAHDCLDPLQLALVLVFSWPHLYMHTYT